jgi:hypothetical protein
MRAHIRQIGVVAAGACIFALLTPFSPVVAEESPVAELAFAQIQSCVSDPDAQLNVLYVVDESGSLTTTDPEGVRADAIAQSLGQLAQLSERRTVYTSIAMFGEGYRVERPWEPLTENSARQEAQWARDTVGGLVGGQGTNWLAALQGAADSMDASPESATACKVVVWMTDGAIVVPSADGTASATVAALAEICAANPENGSPLDTSPVIARLRTSGVNLIGVLLKTGDTDADQRAAMTYMKPIVEGNGTVDPSAFWTGNPPSFDLDCGQVPIPENQAAGAFIEADDPLDLAREFSEMFICIIEPCEQGEVDPGPPATFQIDEGVGYFYALIVGDSWTMRGPSGAPPITTDTNSEGISVSSSGALKTVEVRGQSVAPGTWTVQGAEGEVTLFVFSGINLILEPADRFASESSQLRFTATRDGATLESLDAYSPTTLAAFASQPGQDPLLLPCTQEPGTATFGCEYTPNQVGSVTLRAVLPLMTNAGTQFPDVVLQTSIRVQPPPDYPKVLEPADGAGAHQLTALIGRRGAAQGSFTLEGPGRGDGEICFPSASGITIEVDPQPERIPSYTFSGLPSDCVAIGQGSTSQVTLTVANPVSASGTVEGSFVVTLKSSSRSQEASQDVVFTFASERKADPPIALLIGLGLLALAIPIGLLYLQSTRAARLDLR